MSTTYMGIYLRGGHMLVGQITLLQQVESSGVHLESMGECKVLLWGEGHKDSGTLWTRWKQNQLTRLNLILKGVLVNFLTHPWTSKLTKKWLRTNLFNEPFLLDSGSTSSLGSSKVKPGPIIEMKANPKDGDVQLPNASLNAKNVQKMSENTLYQSWAFLTLILQYLPSPTSKRWLLCIGLALCGHSPCVW